VDLRVEEKFEEIEGCVGTRKFNNQSRNIKEKTGSCDGSKRYGIPLGDVHADSNLRESRTVLRLAPSFLVGGNPQEEQLGIIKAVAWCGRIQICYLLEEPETEILDSSGARTGPLKPEQAPSFPP
jgi:hypothetical protein